MASNPHVNQVGLADGTILIDLTTDTAVATDVKTGKYFHLATGERVQGSCTYDSDTTDANALASEILSGRTAYVNKNKVTGEMTNNGAVSGTISTKAGTYTVPAGYHSGLGSVSIDSTEQAKIIAENIKSGVTILGVEGTYSGQGATATSVNVTPYLTAATVLPPTGYDYISQVNVAAITITESDNAAGGKTVTIGAVDPAA
jgi:hypothetical protein